MKIKLLSTFKYLACLIAFLSLFPLIALVNGAFSYSFSDTDCLLQLIYTVGFGFLGYLFSFFTQNKRRKKPVLINLLFILTLLAPIVITYSFLHAKGILLSIFMAVITAASYFIGGRIFYKNYRDIISTYIFFVVIAENIISIFVLWLAKKPYNIGQFIVIFLIILALYGVISNQSNIDYLMERRQHKFENLPKKIRYYNIKLLSIIFGTILLLFILRNWIIIGVYWTADIFREIVKFIFYIINLILSSLFKNIIIEGDIPQSPEQQFPMDDGDVKSHDWITLLVIAAVIFLIIKKRNQILKFIINLVNRITDFIKKALNRSYIFKKPNEYNEYYYDNEEFIKPDEFLKKSKKKSDLKMWRKSCGSFYNMENSVEKFRFGYGLVIRGLKLKGIKIEKSNTTNEILLLSGKIINNNSFSTATGYYNSLRYGNFDFDAYGIENLTEALKILDNYSKV